MPVEGITPGFFLCVARLLAYKNIDAVVAAFAGLTADQLVIAGHGPEQANLKRMAPANVRFVGAVSDGQLAWLYANCAGVVAAAYEDYGLTPLEAAAFGKPSLVLRWGGFLDTVIADETGIFFDSPTPSEIRQAVLNVRHRTFNREVIRSHAARYSEESFIRQLRAIVAQVQGESVSLESSQHAVAALA